MVLKMLEISMSSILTYFSQQHKKELVAGQRMPHEQKVWPCKHGT
jgi:hypothetical protein